MIETSKELGDVMAAFTSIVDLVGRCEQAASGLLKKIEPVLTQATIKEQNAPLQPDSPATTPLGNRLRVVGDRLSLLAQLLEAADSQVNI